MHSDQDSPPFAHVLVGQDASLGASVPFQQTTRVGPQFSVFSNAFSAGSELSTETNLQRDVGVSGGQDAALTLAPQLVINDQPMLQEPYV